MKDDFSVTVLGADGSWPGPGGACSGYLLQTSSTSIWLDAGSGTFARLQQHVSIDQVDAVILTHQHPDHCFDITGLFGYVTHGPGFDAPLVVFAAPGIAETVFPEKDLDGVFDWRIITSELHEVVGDIAISFDRTDHGPPTFAILAKAHDRSFAYSADTGPRWTFANFNTTIDLALCEAAYPPGISGGGHLNPDQAGSDARRSGVKRLVITHVRPGTDHFAVEVAASASYGAAVPVAEAGNVYSI